MECSVMNLLAPLATELNALNKGDQGAPVTDLVAFENILGSLLSNTSRESAEAIGAGEELMGAIPVQAGALSPLVQQDIPKLLQLLALSQELEKQIGGPAASGEKNRAVGDNREVSQGLGAGELLLRMVSDLINRSAPKPVDANSGGIALTALGRKTFDEGAIEQGGDRMSAEPDKADNEAFPGTDEKLLQSLALLFFNALSRTAYREQEAASGQTRTERATEDAQTAQETVSLRLSADESGGWMSESISASDGMDRERDGSDEKALVERDAQNSWQPGAALTAIAGDGATPSEKDDLDTATNLYGGSREQSGQDSASGRVAHGQRESLPSIPGDDAYALSEPKDSPADRFTQTMNKLLSIDTERSTSGEPKDSATRANDSGDEAKQPLFLLKGTLRNVPQALPTQDASFNGIASGNDTTGVDLRSLIETGEGMRSGVTEVGGDDHTRDSNSRDSGEQGGQPDTKHPSFLIIDQSSADRSINGEKAANPGNPVSTAAVDRLEKIATQTTGRNSHDLTVKLDVGNQETVVVGLKDLGQTIAVEVKASHQGLINLLESQKETIMRHLESREVRAAISVDPNASRNPEGRERREARERAFKSARKTDRTFGQVFEIVA